MPSKPIQLIAYMIYSLISAAAYGVVAFFVIFRWLAAESMLAAYIWNIVFIIVFLLLDKIANDILLSKELVITKRNFFIASAMHLLSIVSFKTMLYLFYIFVIISSGIATLQPELLSEEFQNFILSIEYCLILVMAFDVFIGHLLKDDKRVRRITAKFDRFLKFKTKNKGSS